MTTQLSAADPLWWKGAVIYQIYPRSYQDSTGDGTGDLKGIISRLPYVASLGVDGIWISPFFTSPMKDFGYDVSDYRDVDPMFGSLADFDALIERAHELGLRVLIDLVLSHTSDQHPWFAESRVDRVNAKADWFVWADPKPDGSPPNNWLSIFGGSAWEWEGERMQYYLHNFLIEQPDLNFHNMEVQQELLDVARFWLERGVDGFRLDTINFYVHDQQLRDNPALPPEERNDSIAPAVNPYNWQDHLHDKSQPENLAFLKKLRGVMDAFPGSTLVGEVGDAQRGLAIQAEYTAGGDKVHMCYDFSFLSPMPGGGTRVGEILTEYEAGIGDGWACWAFSNHDVVRHPSRLGLSPEGSKALATLMMAFRGTLCLYQGEELGLGEADVAFEDLQDPYGKRFWPKFKGRDGCRTPMVWESNAANGGFSGTKPWLPVAPEHVALAVNTQEGASDSMLAHYREIIAFRKAHPVLITGDLDIVAAEPGHVVLRRTLGETVMICAVNLGDKPVEVGLGEGAWSRVGPGSAGETLLGMVRLEAYEACFALKQTA